MVSIGTAAAVAGRLKYASPKSVSVAVTPL
jgi:hypothetical protein